MPQPPLPSAASRPSSTMQVTAKVSNIELDVQHAIDTVKMAGSLHTRFEALSLSDDPRPHISCAVGLTHLAHDLSHESHEQTLLGNSDPAEITPPCPANLRVQSLPPQNARKPEQQQSGHSHMVVHGWVSAPNERGEEANAVSKHGRQQRRRRQRRK